MVLKIQFLNEEILVLVLYSEGTCADDKLCCCMDGRDFDERNLEYLYLPLRALTTDISQARENVLMGMKL